MSNTPYDCEELALAKKVAKELNNLYSIDSQWLTNLLRIRVVCSDELAHKTLVTTPEVNTPERHYEAGPFGLINGLLGPDLTVSLVDDEFKVCRRDIYPPEVVDA